MPPVRFVAIGDSFTEGVGDELPDGRVRGWADLVAQGWADASDEPIEYANLAIRGRLVWPIIDEQLEPALALKPTHLSFNGGGNDMLRPKASVSRIVSAFTHVVERCDEEGVKLIILSGANPSGSFRWAAYSSAAATCSPRRSPRPSRIDPTSSARSTGRIGSCPPPRTGLRTDST